MKLYSTLHQTFPAYKCISALTGRSEYLGCWAIDDELQNISLPNISVTECRLFCTAQIFQFAILSGDTCYCVNLIATYTALKDDMCTDLCFSNNTFEREYCGNQNFSAYSVYNSFRMMKCSILLMQFHKFPYSSYTYDTYTPRALGFDCIEKDCAY